MSRQAEFRRAWPVVLASAFGAGTGAVPLAFYSFGALIGPLQRAFGWTRAEITAAAAREYAQFAELLGGAANADALAAFADRRELFFHPRTQLAGLAGQLA